MAIFNITNLKGGATIVQPPFNKFGISTNTSKRCGSKNYQIVDNFAYHNSVSHLAVSIGDTIYSDVGLTTLYNLTGQQKDYNINNGLFLTLDAGSVVIQTPC